MSFTERYQYADHDQVQIVSSKCGGTYDCHSSLAPKETWMAVRTALRPTSSARASVHKTIS